jgi:hypothetical protein
MMQRPKLTPAERLKTLFVRLMASLARLTALETSPRLQRATPPNPATRPLLILAMLAVDMEEYECRLRRADNAS